MLELYPGSLCTVSNLLNELAVAHGDGTVEKIVKTYQRITLLILDEFLLSSVSSEQAHEPLEIIKSRNAKGSIWSAK